MLIFFPQVLSDFAYLGVTDFWQNVFAFYHKVWRPVDDFLVCLGVYSASNVVLGVYSGLLRGGKEFYLIIREVSFEVDFANSIVQECISDLTPNLINIAYTEKYIA